MKENFLKYLSSFLFSYKAEERKSPVSGKVEVLYTGGKYVLDSAHVNYSFGGLHAVFQKAFTGTKIKDRNIKNALLLGFGSGSVASILQDEYGKKVTVTGVEKDPEVIDLAKKYFSIDRYKGLTVHCEDAWDFVLRCDQKFDLVVMDVFVDRDVPEKFSEEKFISSLGNLISENGILFYNLVVHSEKVRDKGAKLFRQLGLTLGNVEWLRIRAGGTENWVFVCDTIKKP